PRRRLDEAITAGRETGLEVGSESTDDAPVRWRRGNALALDDVIGVVPRDVADLAARLERLLGRVGIRPAGCWLWEGCRPGASRYATCAATSCASGPIIWFAKHSGDSGRPRPDGGASSSGCSSP